ncbi:MAG: heme NO-binding domain-containing protein [Pirellulaceae bacterium]
MRGIIFTELRRFVIEKFGRKTWIDLLLDAGVDYPKKMYVATASYDDSEIELLAGAAVRLTGLTRDQILDAFGASLASGLLTKYKFLIRPEWTLEDVLLNIETTIHQVVRAKHPDANPPELKVERSRAGELKMLYFSKRKMAALAKGLIKGTASFLGEQAVVRGKPKEDGSCEILISILEPAHQKDEQLQPKLDARKSLIKPRLRSLGDSKSHIFRKAHRISEKQGT